MTGGVELAADLAASLSPSGTLQRAYGIEAEAWQRSLAACERTRVLVLAARQVGKSLSTCGRALHRIVYEPPCLVLCVAPTQRQSGEWFYKLRQGYKTLGRPVKVLAENESELRLGNGFRVVALPGSDQTVRSFSSVDVLVLDEAAWVDEATWAAVLPMVALGGQVIACTTPGGTQGEFYRLWTEGGEDWRRFKITCWDSGQYPSERIEQRRAELSPRRFQSELECDFQAGASNLFAGADIAAAFAHEPTAWRGFPRKEAGHALVS